MGRGGQKVGLCSLVIREVYCGITSSPLLHDARGGERRRGHGGEGLEGEIQGTRSRGSSMCVGLFFLYIAYELRFFIKGIVVFNLGIFCHFIIWFLFGSLVTVNHRNKSFLESLVAVRYCDQAI